MTLSNAELDELALTLPLIKQWVAAVEEEMETRLNAGGVFNNIELVPKRAIRAWGDEAAVMSTLSALNFTADEFSPRVLLSPSQCEKVLGKKTMAQLSGFITKESSGLKLAYTA